MTPPIRPARLALSKTAKLAILLENAFNVLQDSNPEQMVCATLLEPRSMLSVPSANTLNLEPPTVCLAQPQFPTAKHAPTPPHASDAILDSLFRMVSACLLLQLRALLDSIRESLHVYPAAAPSPTARNALKMEELAPNVLHLQLFPTEFASLIPTMWSVLLLRSGMELLVQSLPPLR